MKRVHLLTKSKDLPYSLHAVFGPTQSTGGKTRSVTTRAHVLEELGSADNPLTVADIANKLDIRMHVVGRHLKLLNNLGLVEYDSLGGEERRAQLKFRLNERVLRSQVKKVRSMKILTEETVDILFRVKEVSYQSLFEMLRPSHVNIKDQSIRNAIYVVINGLVMQGICKKAKYRAGYAYSRTNITENGRAIVNEIILPIKRALSGDEELLDRWKKINWGGYAKDALAKYIESSGYCNRHTQEERTAQVLLVIKENIGGIRPNKIKSLLGFNPGNHLKFLLDQHLVVRKKQGIGAFYFAVNPQHLN